MAYYGRDVVKGGTAGKIAPINFKKHPIAPIHCKENHVWMKINSKNFFIVTLVLVQSCLPDFSESFGFETYLGSIIERDDKQNSILLVVVFMS